MLQVARPFLCRHRGAQQGPAEGLHVQGRGRSQKQAALVHYSLQPGLGGQPPALHAVTAELVPSLHASCLRLCPGYCVLLARHVLNSPRPVIYRSYMAHVWLIRHMSSRTKLVMWQSAFPQTPPRSLVRASQPPCNILDLQVHWQQHFATSSAIHWALHQLPVADACSSLHTSPITSQTHTVTSYQTEQNLSGCHQGGWHQLLSQQHPKPYTLTQCPAFWDLCGMGARFCSDVCCTWGQTKII